MPKRVIIVPHGEADHHISKLVGGWYNSSLTPKGEEQALKTAKAIEKLIGDEEYSLFSSDLNRAHETAAIIGKHLSLEVNLTEDIREMSFGEAEGKSGEWLKANELPFTGECERVDHAITKGGESRAQVAKRTRRFMDEVLKSHDNLILVTHGFAHTFLIAAFQKIPAEHQGQLTYNASPCCITMLEGDFIYDNRTLTVLNSTEHLR